MSPVAALGTTSTICVRAVVKDMHDAASNEHALDVISTEELADMQQKI